MKKTVSRGPMLRRARQLTVLAPALLQAAAAIAADEAPATANPARSQGSTELKEVEVRLRARDKARTVDVQAAPSAVTSFSGAKLEEQNVTNVRDLAGVVPNLYQPRTAVSYLNSSFFIRGIGEPDAQGEPSVAVYIDDLYQPKNLGVNQELLDIERVDIWRGPQGQAFGHSAIAGAIRLQTTLPSERYTLRAAASYGNYNDVRLGVATSGPLGGDWFGSLAVSRHLRDGFDQNVTVDRDVNDINYGAARGKLRWRPSADLDVVFSLGGVRDTSSARGVQNLSYGDDDVHNQLYPQQSFNNHAASATVNWQIQPGLRFRSVTGASGFQQTVMFDNTGDYYGRGSQWVNYKDRSYSQEFQLLGETPRLEYVTGLYLYREHWFTNRRANTAASANTTPSYRPVYSLIDQDTNNVAVYGEGKYKVTPELTATLGLRYNWELHTQDNQLYDLASGNVNAANFLNALYGPPLNLLWNAQGKKTWSTWSPRVSLDYKWQPSLLQYVTYSEGTKSGGYDYRAQTRTSAGLAQASLPFNPEVSHNLETGIKADWWDGRLRTNLSAFYTKFSDIQITTTDPTQTPAITRRYNAGEGSTRGIELEGSLKADERLNIDFSGGWLRARLDKFSGPIYQPVLTNALTGLYLRAGPYAGATLPNAPKWTARVAATWRLPVGGPGTWTLHSNLSYQSESYTDTTNNDTVKLPAQTYWNGSISYAPEASKWTITLAGQNLANKRYKLGQGYTAASNVANTAIYRTTNYNDPRTVTLGFRYEY